MAGRKKKPTELIQGHRSNKYFDIREKSEQQTRVGKPDLGRTPEELGGDPLAVRKWIELKELYNNFKFVTSADRDIISQYCTQYGSYRRAVNARDEYIANLKGKGASNTAIQAAVQESEVEKEIERRVQLMQKLGDKIFLSPTARINSVPEKKDAPKSNPLESAGFGGI